MYEIFEHTADLGLRVQADSLDALFADAARGLLSMIVANPDDVQPVVERRYQLEGEEPDLLLFDWLNEVLYTFESEKLLLVPLQISVEESEGQKRLLTATCRGEAMDETRHQMEHEVKAITYHGLSVQRQDGKWVAEVIVDI